MALLDQYKNPSLSTAFPKAVAPKDFKPASAPIPVSSLTNTINTTALPVEPNMTQQYQQATQGATASFTTPSGATVDAQGNMLSQPQQTPAPINTPEDKSLADRIKEMLGFAPSAPTSTVDTYNQLAEQQGLAQQQQEVADLSAQLGAITAQTKTQQLGLETQDVRRTQGVLDRQQGQIAREQAIRALPISAALNAAQGRLSAAQDNINTILTLTQKDNEAQYQYQKDQLDYAIQFATADQEARLQQQKTELDAQKAQVDEFNKVNAIYTKAAMDAGDFKTAGALATATSYEELSQLASQIQNTNQDLQFVSGTDNQPSGYFNKNTGVFTSLGGGGGKGAGVSVAGLTPEQASDPFVAKMLATKGGKPLTDTFAQKIDKGLVVLGQIGALQTNIDNTKTGPILGLFKGNNPWDTNAQTIKAQLNAIVPNLARGVYGEVGVLTDNDIANYSKTLPNLKSTEDVRNAVLGITIDMIGKSIKNTLAVNAANGKDVSGFVDLYNEMNATRDSIFAQISSSREDADVFDSVVPPESSSWMTNLWNSLF